MVRLGEVDLYESPPEHMCQGEVLKILSPEAIDGWEVRGKEETIAIEYFTETADDRLLLVTATNRSLTYRVFFGPKRAVAERGLVSFVRHRNGGTTFVNFLVDGERAEAVFPVRCSDEHTGGCPGRLTIGDEVLALSPSPHRATRADLPPASFVCNTHHLRVSVGEADEAALRLLNAEFFCTLELAGPRETPHWEAGCRRMLEADELVTLVRVDGHSGRATLQGLLTQEAWEVRVARGTLAEEAAPSWFIDRR